MSGADYFRVEEAINPYMHAGEPVDTAQAIAEHQSIKQALETAGTKVIQIPAPSHSQDGVYTANWALVRGKKAVMSRLPAARKSEEAYAAQVLQDLGKEIIIVPDELHFSGQGDSLPCGNYLFAGSQYRSDPRAQQFVADRLGYELIQLQAIPQRSLFGIGPAVINASSGWPDSFFYDIDIALAVIRPDLIAWCPAAFTKHSQQLLRSLPIEKIEVSLHEAKQAFACNLVSTGNTVVMSDRAPQLQAALESRGIKTLRPNIRQLIKGGGYIRCTTLTLDNE